MSATGETQPKQESNKSVHAEKWGKLPVGITVVERIVVVDTRAAAASHYMPGWAADHVPVLLFALFACGFGALHCLAWNSQFPTWKEQLVWRICSATMTTVPLVVSLLIALVVVDNHIYGAVITAQFMPLVLFLYVIGRITVIVLAFTSLRALPADAFRTIDWNSYIPHLAA